MRLKITWDSGSMLTFTANWLESRILKEISKEIMLKGKHFQLLLGRNLSSCLPKVDGFLKFLLSLFLFLNASLISFAVNFPNVLKS